MTGVLCVGPYILDILVRPVDELPRTQNSVLVEQIRLTAAGTAGGTAVDLARLGLPTAAVGAIGDDDAGDLLLSLLRRHGVDTGRLAVLPGTATASTVLPVRTDGTRAAWHARGANARLGPEHVPWDELDGYDFVHAGGVTALPALDGDGFERLLRAAKAAGATTTADCLGVKRADALDLLARYLPHVDVFLPNDEEALGISGAADPAAAAEVFLSLGAGAVIVTLGAAGCLLATPSGQVRLPALDVPAVDATGCGDAFTAGVILGLATGRDLEAAAWLGTAAASLTVQGLGSDAGRLTRQRVHDQLATAARRPLPAEVPS